MKTKAKVHKVTKMAAQGDVLFRRVDKVPAGFDPQPEAKRVIVAHSETGHHHSIDVAGVRHFVGAWTYGIEANALKLEIRT